MKRSRIWDTFLPIPAASTTSEAPPLDSDWLAAIGAGPGAPLILSLLETEVFPVVRRLARTGRLEWYMFLLHDRNSGVPTTPEDKGAYVHLRLVFRRSQARPALPKAFQMTYGREELPDTTGRVARLIGYQSEWVERLVSSLPHTDDAARVREVRQFLHYFANMTQIKVA